MTNTTKTLTQDVLAILADNGWHQRWASCDYAVTDEYGNAAMIHQHEDGVRIDFEYALPGVVEILDLSDAHGARRIARAILALASPDE